MTRDEEKKLEHIVERSGVLQAQIDQAKEEMKELADSAWEKCGVKPKVIKQLVKEKGWNEIERMAQHQLEESLDECRKALGMLADLPLGEHAVERKKKQQPKKLEPALN
jgi:hypothetical protein